jgi:type I restriction enzyme S subunit
MIADLRPYPDYKSSGQPWLPRVPAHWEMRRNARLFAHRIETGFPELPVLEVSIRAGVRVRDMGEGRKQVMSDFGKYKRACEGDIAYNMMRMWQGAVGIAPVDGLVSPAYVVARPYEGANSAYYNLVFRTEAYMGEVNNASRGIVSDRNRLYWDDFKQMGTPFPPTDEQSAIVRFLAALDRRVSRFVRAKRRLIELLTEQKQAIITHAVTRGLNPNAKLKSSGIDVLGDVPQHWEVRRLRNVARLLVSNVDKHSRANESPVRLCNYTDVYKNRTITDQLKFMQATASPEEIERFRIRRGDVIITKDSEVWTDIAVPSLVEFEADDLVCGYHLAMLRPREVARGAYLLNALLAKSVAVQFHIAAKGVTRYGLSHSVIKDIVLPVPPLTEQDAIVTSISAQTKEIERTIRGAQREIDLLREYRTRLVADVVTGKLDVRAAAARLPEDETDASEPLDAVAKDAGDGLAEDDALGDEGAREGADETLAALE